MRIGRSSRPSGCSPPSARAGIPVFYCTQDHRPQNRPDGAISTRRKEKPANAADHGIYHEFTPQPSDVIIYKQRASVFQGTPFLSHLNLLGIRSLIVCGESTSGCVRASTVDAYSNGFHVSIVEECTFDRVGTHPQGQSVRPASQICRRDASRRGRSPPRSARGQAVRATSRGIVRRQRAAAPFSIELSCKLSASLIDRLRSKRLRLSIAACRCRRRFALFFGIDAQMGR